MPSLATHPPPLTSYQQCRCAGHTLSHLRPLNLAQRLSTETKGSKFFIGAATKGRPPFGGYLERPSLSWKSCCMLTRTHRHSSTLSLHLRSPGSTLQRWCYLCQRVFACRGSHIHECTCCKIMPANCIDRFLTSCCTHRARCLHATPSCPRAALPSRSWPGLIRCSS